ncbi:MAG: CPBP family intramembrane glutamic endopeptidase [Anaerolineae bacterium]
MTNAKPDSSEGDMAEITLSAEEQQADRRLTWKLFGLLMLGAVIGLLGIIPYSLSLSGPLPPLPIPLWLLLILQIGENLVLFAVAVGLGLSLGRKVGLGAPILRGWLAGEPDVPSRFRLLLAPASMAGAASAIAILALEVGVFAPRLSASPEISTGPPAWQGFLASFYGGINEELLLRFGVMTLLVWLGSKLTRSEQPGAGVVWTANLLAAVLFGLGHLPATAAILPLTALVVTRAVVLNGLAGVVFGWLYWRRGLLAAMVAHFSADIVLHVLAPLVLG